jgi:hypothetical protein
LTEGNLATRRSSDVADAGGTTRSGSGDGGKTVGPGGTRWRVTMRHDDPMPLEPLDVPPANSRARRWLTLLRLAVVLAAAGGLVAAVVWFADPPPWVVTAGLALLVLGLALAPVSAMAYGRATGLTRRQALALALRTLGRLLFSVG